MRWTGIEPPEAARDRLQREVSDLESERDALRAEVEVLRRAMEILADWTYAGSDCPPWPKPHDCIGEDRAACNKCVSQWAISEARKS
jgi:hypothetical protein